MPQRILLTLVIVLMAEHPAHSQLLADTLFTWRGYTRQGICGFKLYKNPEQDAKGYTVILKELAENPGPSTIDEIGYLAERIGRIYDLDPTDAYWVSHWSHFSFNEASVSKKELFVRATFNWTATKRISAPKWRIIRREDIEKYTDRQFLK